MKLTRRHIALIATLGAGVAALAWDLLGPDAARAGTAAASPDEPAAGAAAAEPGGPPSADDHLTASRASTLRVASTRLEALRARLGTDVLDGLIDPFSLAPRPPADITADQDAAASDAGVSDAGAGGSTPGAADGADGGDGALLTAERLRPELVIIGAEPAILVRGRRLRVGDMIEGATLVAIGVRQVVYRKGDQWLAVPTPTRAPR